MPDGHGAIIVFGAGGHGRECAWVAEAAGWRVSSFVAADPLQPVEGTFVGPRLGEAAFRAAAPQDGFAAIAGVGSGQTRLRIASEWDERCFWPMIAHPTAVIAESARLGPGVIVFPQAIVGVDVTAGAHVVIGAGATLSHDVRLGDGVTVAPGAHIAGAVSIGDGAFIGVGAAIRHATPERPIRIGAGATIGAGSAVVSDVPAGAVVGGAPARALGEARPSAD